MYNELREMESWLKRNLKNRVNITTQNVVAFLITGLFVSTTTFAENTDSKDSKDKKNNTYLENIKKLKARINSGEGIEIAEIESDTENVYIHVNTGDKDQAAGDSYENSGPIGSKAGALGENSITIGIQAKTAKEATNSIAMGVGTKVNKEYSLAFGTANTIDGSNAISVGNENNLGINEEFFTSKYQIAVGNKNKITGSNSSILGNETTVTGNNSGIFGQGIYSGGGGSSGRSAFRNAEEPMYGIHSNNTYAIGNNNRVEKGFGHTFVMGNHSLIGRDPFSPGKRVGAIGILSIGNFNHIGVGRDDLSEGNYNSNDNIAFGNHITVGYGSSNNTIVGNMISIANKNGETPISNGTVLGNEAKITASTAVALGANSIANREGFITSTPGKYSNEELKDITLGAVSVGTDKKLRQIINVGDATEATDAVNLRQLDAAIETVKNNAGGGSGTSFDITVNEGVEAPSDGDYSENDFEFNTDTFTFKRNNLQVRKDPGTGKVDIRLGKRIVLGDEENSSIVLDGNKGLLRIGADDFTDDTEAKGIVIDGKNRNIYNAGGESRISGTYEDFEGNTTTIDDDPIHNNAIALGENTLAAAKNAVALGGESLAIGENATAIGYYSKAYANNSFAALGGVVGNEGYSSAAIGNGASTNLSGTVALGSWSVADRKAEYVGYGVPEKKQPTTRISMPDTIFDLNGGGEGPAWKSRENAISIGEVHYSDGTDGHEYGEILDQDDAITRQIIGVAAGTFDTDAVNVAQLRAVEEKIKNKSEGGSGGGTGTSFDTDVHFFSGGKNENGTYTQNTKGKFDLNIKDLTFDFGDGFKIEKVNDGSKDIALISIDESKFGGSGSGIQGPEGPAGQDGAPGPQGPKGDKGDPGKDGKDGKDGADYNYVGDENIKITKDIPNNKVNITLEPELKNISTMSNGDDGAKLTLSSTDRNIDVGDGKITSVAAGEVSENSTDAVNGSQLYAVDQKVNNFGDAIQNNAKNINKLGKRVDRVGSLSAALAGLHPMQYDPLNPNQVMAAMGTYRGSQAVAVGASHYFNEKLMMSAGVSVETEGKKPEVMGNVGFTYKFGGKEERERRHLPKEYDGKQMASIYIMQTEVYKERLRNQQQAEKMRIQELKIKDIEKKVNSQLSQEKAKNQRLEKKLENLLRRLEKLEGVGN